MKSLHVVFILNRLECAANWQARSKTTASGARTNSTTLNKKSQQWAGVNHNTEPLHQERHAGNYDHIAPKRTCAKTYTSCHGLSPTSSVFLIMLCVLILWHKPLHMFFDCVILTRVHENQFAVTCDFDYVAG